MVFEYWLSAIFTVPCYGSDVDPFFAIGSLQDIYRMSIQPIFRMIVPLIQCSRLQIFYSITNSLMSKSVKEEQP